LGRNKPPVNGADVGNGRMGWDLDSRVFGCSDIILRNRFWRSSFNWEIVLFLLNPDDLLSDQQRVTEKYHVFFLSFWKNVLVGNQATLSFGRSICRETSLRYSSSPIFSSLPGSLFSPVSPMIRILSSRVSSPSPSPSPSATNKTMLLTF